MAISIIKQKTANSFHSSANPITLTVDSNNSGKCNFRYICDVYINNTKVFTAKLFPDPLTGYGFFQIDRVCNDWVEALIEKTWLSNAWNLGGSATAPTSVITVQCKFGEEYDNSALCTGTVLQYPNLGISTQFYVFHGSVPYEDWPTFSANDYRVIFASQSGTTKFLTAAPRELNIGYNEPYYLDVMGTQSPGVYNASGYPAIRYRIYYKDGNPTEVRYYPAPSLTNTKRWRIHAGSYDINRLYNKSLISDATTHYQVDVVWLSYNMFVDPSYTVHQTLTETFTFIPKDNSPFRTRIGFLGSLGSIESYTFFHRNVKAYDIERKVYNKGLLRNYANEWTYQVGDRGQSVAWSKVGERHKVSTFTTKEESKWITEMFYSPEVFVYSMPTMYSFHTTPRAAYVDVWIDGDHDIKAGDYIFLFFKYKTGTDFLQPNVTQVIAAGERKLTVNLPWSNSSDYVGCLCKKESWKVLPIVISDTAVEEKQKTGRPIQYDITYTTSYPKITIK